MFDGLETLKHPSLTAENWHKAQPCLEFHIGSSKLVLTQPLSSFLVYFLGFQTILVAARFLQNAVDNQAGYLWGISLLLWGAGAIIAGTSYQAFGYHIKCAGRESALWTSWWEVIYLMLQKVSIDTILVSVAVLCAEGVAQTILFAYAGLTALMYVVVVFWAALKPIKSWLTFERMLLVVLPVWSFLLVLNASRYATHGNPLDLVLSVTWVALFLAWFVYHVYDRFGFTEILWSKGVWFSQNDVLHVALILWIFWIDLELYPLIQEYRLTTFN